MLVNLSNANTFENEDQYKDAKHKYDENQKASIEWCRANKTNGIPHEVYSKFPFADEVNNEMRSKLEVWEFLNDIPKKYFLYIREEDKTAITFTGAKLGDVSFGSTYRSNFGDTRQSIDVYGINGKKYHGIYFKEAGQYARIKLYKNQKAG